MRAHDLVILIQNSHKINNFCQQHKEVSHVHVNTDKCEIYKSEDEEARNVSPFFSSIRKVTFSFPLISISNCSPPSYNSITAIFSILSQRQQRVYLMPVKGCQRNFAVIFTIFGDSAFFEDTRLVGAFFEYSILRNFVETFTRHVWRATLPRAFHSSLSRNYTDNWLARGCCCCC